MLIGAARKTFDGLFNEPKKADPKKPSFDKDPEELHGRGRPVHAHPDRADRRVEKDQLAANAALGTQSATDARQARTSAALGPRRRSGRAPRNGASVRSRFILTQVARVLPGWETRHAFGRRARNARSLRRHFDSDANRGTPSRPTVPIAAGVRVSSAVSQERRASESIRRGSGLERNASSKRKIDGKGLALLVSGRLAVRACMSRAGVRPIAAGALSGKPRLRSGMADDRTYPDPPMAPSPGASRWYESGPEPIIADETTARMMVRVGLAFNAFVVQMEASRVVRTEPDQDHYFQRRAIGGLLITCGVVVEALRLVRGCMGPLRQFASKAGAEPRLLDAIGRLCAGNHPAAPFITRVRQTMAFHFDEEPIADAVRSYGRNQRIVWLESKDDRPLHTLSSGVLGHSLFPGAADAGEEALRAAAREMFENLEAAINLLTEFMTAATYGYLESIGAERRSR